MPISVAEAFTQAAPPPTPPATSGEPPAADPKAVPPSKQKGVSIASLYANAPKPPPGPVAKAIDKAKPVAKEVGHALSEAGIAGAKPYLDDGVKWANSYADAIKDDLKAYPEGTGNQVLHSLKTANDMLGYALGPVMSPIYTGLIDPVKKAIAKVGDLVQRHAEEDTYDAQARRMGEQQTPGGQTKNEFKSSVGWAIHKRDVTAAVGDLQEATEALINAGTAFVAPEKLLGKSKVPEKMTMTPEQAGSAARVAVRDAKAAFEPKEPALTPISLKLDASMGFGKISDNVGPYFNQLPSGSIRTAGEVLQTMLPHAEGYAKAFLTKLSEAVDPTLPITFKSGNLHPNFPDADGLYYHESNKISIRQGQDAPSMIHSISHELYHSATIQTMNDLIEGEIKTAEDGMGRELTPKESLAVITKPKSPLLRELDTIIKEARVRAVKAGLGGHFYGLSTAPTAPKATVATKGVNLMHPRNEFTAELFSNPKFQQFLANSEKYASAGYKWKNMLNQFGTMIGKHLGLGGAANLRLLNHAMRVGSRLIEVQKPGVTHKGMGQIVFHSPEEHLTITRGDMQRATELPNAKLVDGAAVRRARSSIAITIEQVLRGIAPETLGKNAKLAASVVASRITEQMQRTSAYMHGAETRLKFWRGRPDLTGEFIKGFESGKTFSDPVLDRLAKNYRDWNKRIFAQDTKITHLDYEPRENYLYHVFEDSEGVAEYFQKKYGSKWGDPGFIKDRTFDLYQEAIAAGFRPRFDTPEDIMLARQHASDIAEMHTGILSDLEKYGLATLKVKGGSKIVKKLDADGKMSFDVDTTEGTKQPPDTARYRAPNGDVYWVDNKAAIILDNAFKSKSLWEDKGGIGLAYRGMMALKNTIVPIRLAISLFHPLHVTGIDMAASWSRTAGDFMSGTVGVPKAFGQILRGGFGPLFENVRDGWRIMKVWKGHVPGAALNAADAETLKYIIEGGMIPEMSTQYRTNARQNFVRAWQEAKGDFRSGHIGGGLGDTTRAVWHAPWALLSAIQAPIFEHWIPALKSASYIKDVKSALQRNPSLTEDDAARQLALRKIAKSVDNRYGEMAYNTLFWKRYVKDIAVLNTLSLGWQMGFIREYGGGALDVGQFALGGSKLQRIKEGQLDRPLFIAAYTTLGAATAGLMTYGMTGEVPEGMDYINPRTGEKNADGSPQRVTTMFYSREFAALHKHIQNAGVVEGVSKLVMNKSSGLFGLMHEWASGVNDFGQEIRDPNGDAFQKVEETLAYTMSDLEPITMKAIQSDVSQNPTKAGVMDVMGFTPEPKYMSDSQTTATVKDYFERYVAPKQTPYDKAQYSKEYKSLREAYQTGSEKLGDILDHMTEKYELSGHDQRRIMKSLNSDIPPEVRMFMRLPWQQQKDVLDKASPEERELYLPHANKAHIRNSYEAPQQ